MQWICKTIEKIYEKIEASNGLNLQLELIQTIDTHLTKLHVKEDYKRIEDRDNLQKKQRYRWNTLNCIMFRNIQ